MLPTTVATYSKPLASTAKNISSLQIPSSSLNEALLHSSLFSAHLYSIHTTNRVTKPSFHSCNPQIIAIFCISFYRFIGLFSSNSYTIRVKVITHSYYRIPSRRNFHFSTSYRKVFIYFPAFSVLRIKITRTPSGS